MEKGERGQFLDHECRKARAARLTATGWFQVWGMFRKRVGLCIYNVLCLPEIKCYLFQSVEISVAIRIAACLKSGGLGDQFLTKHRECVASVAK